jgi:hypothetical protein
MKKNSTPDRQNGDSSNQVNDSSCAPVKVLGMSVQWSDQSKQVTQMAGLAYFVQFLEATGLFDHFVESCPLTCQSNNAPHQRAVLGTILLSVLNGHTRYAHMSALSGSALDAQLLKMQSIPSEDSIRSALRKLVDSPEGVEQTYSWLSGCFEQFHEGVFQVPWILDVDATVKPLYGKQQGAVVGYNPTKPGRPSHVYHSFWVAHLRLCLDVQVLPGNQTAGSFSLGNLLEWLKQRSSEQLPQFVRGDISYGTQRWMNELEALEIAYLFKLKQTRGVKELIAASQGWTAHFSGWQYCESTLQLSGWDCSRRVVVYRRAHRRKVKAVKRKPELFGPIKESEQLPLELIGEEEMPSYEYAVYVTSLARPAQEIHALYNPRADNENCYDELKNQWGWCGFTVRDLARSELMARLIALIYNWWSLYTKLVDEQIAREAITSRPMFLLHIAKMSTHQSMRTLVIFCAHAQAKQIQEKLEAAARRLKQWALLTAEQLKARSLWKRIIEHILANHRSFGGQNYRAPPMLAAST